MDNWIISTIYSTGYFGILLLMFIENVFPPIPSELIMPLAGFMVLQEKLSLWGVIAAGTAGSIAGALPLYYIGAKMGKERFTHFISRHGKWFTLTVRDIEKADRWFENHGSNAVFICRLIPGIRSLISIPAGINRMNFGKFLFFTFLGTALWTALLAYAGYFLGRNFKEMEQYLGTAGYVVFGLIILLYLWRVIAIHRSGNKNISSASQS